jgi:hypothetical protein
MRALQLLTVAALQDDYSWCRVLVELDQGVL